MYEKKIIVKKIVFTCVLNLSLALGVFAQDSQSASEDSTRISEELNKQRYIYHLARLYNDPIMERMALYNMIAEEPSFMIFRDSLALHYYKSNEIASAALVAQQTVNRNPENILAVEIAAEAFDRLGVKDKALRHFEKLYLSINDINILYKMAFLQYELERFTQANTSLNIIMGDSTSNDQNISFPTTDGEVQGVSLNVAARRVKAMIEVAKGNREEAVKQFLDILKVQPNFQVVQQQLRELTAKKEE